MKNKFKVSIWTILLASGILSLGLASCNKPNSSSSTSSSSSSISTSTSSSISSTISSSSSTSSISSNPNVRTYVVTFVDQNGSTNLGSTSVEKGGKIAEFPEVIDDGSGHEFAGWYYQGKPFDENTPINSRITLQARYYYSVTYLDSDNNVLEVKKVVYGNSIKASEAPAIEAPEHFTFNNWLLDGKEFIFASAITSDIRLTPNFTYELEGDGTSSSPFLLKTKTDIIELAKLISNGSYKKGVNYSTGYYSLENNIELTEEDKFSGFPVFSGIIDGNGNKISGITISPASQNSSVGFFTELINAQISNLKLDIAVSSKNANINNSKVGGLAGRAINSTLVGIELNVNIDIGYKGASRATVGGLVGEIEDTTIDSCLVKGEVVGGSLIGGLVGYASNNSFISQSYSGAYLGNYRTATLGGLVAYLSEDSKIYASLFDGNFYQSTYVSQDDVSYYLLGAGYGDFSLCFQSYSSKNEFYLQDFSAMPWSKENWTIANDSVELKVIPTTHKELTVTLLNYNSDGTTYTDVTKIGYGENFSSSDAKVINQQNNVVLSNSYVLSIGDAEYYYSAEYPLYADISLKAKLISYDSLTGNWIHDENESVNIHEDSNKNVLVSGVLPTSDSKGIKFENVSATVTAELGSYLMYSSGKLIDSTDKYERVHFSFVVDGTNYRVYEQRLVDSTIKSFIMYEEEVGGEWIKLTGNVNSPDIAKIYSQTLFVSGNLGYSMNLEDQTAIDMNGNKYTYTIYNILSATSSEKNVGFTLSDEKGNKVAEFLYQDKSSIVKYYDYESGKSDKTIYTIPYTPFEGLLTSDSIPSSLNTIGVSNADYSFKTKLESDGTLSVIYNGGIYTPKIDIFSDGSYGYYFEADGKKFVLSTRFDSNSAIGVAIYLEVLENDKTIVSNVRLKNYTNLFDNETWCKGNDASLTINDESLTFNGKNYSYDYAFIKLDNKSKAQMAIRFTDEGKEKYLVQNSYNFASIYTLENGQFVSEGLINKELADNVLKVFKHKFIAFSDNSILDGVVSGEYTYSFDLNKPNVINVTSGSDVLAINISNKNNYRFTLNGSEVFDLNANYSYIFEELVLPVSDFQNSTYFYEDLSFAIKSIGGKEKLTMTYYDLSHNKKEVNITVDKYGNLSFTDGGNNYRLDYEPTINKEVYSDTLVINLISSSSSTPTYYAVLRSAFDQYESDVTGTWKIIDRNGDSIVITIKQDTIAEDPDDAENHLVMTFKTIVDGVESTPIEASLFFVSESVSFYALIEGKPAYILIGDGTELLCYYNAGSSLSNMTLHKSSYFNFYGTWIDYGYGTNYTLNISSSGAVLDGGDLHYEYESLDYVVENGMTYLVGQDIVSVDLDSDNNGTAIINQLSVYYFNEFVYVLNIDFTVEVVSGNIVGTLSSNPILSGEVFYSDFYTQFNGIYEIEGETDDVIYTFTFEDGLMYLTGYQMNEDGTTSFDCVSLTSDNIRQNIVRNADGSATYSIVVYIGNSSLFITLTLSADGEVTFKSSWGK